MKPILRLFGLKSFLIIFLILTGFNVTGQLGIKVDKTFSSDTTFQPFQGNYQTYALNISGDVQLLSDSSLIRVVMIDSYGNHYLVFETYPLISLNSNFGFEQICDETCYLNGIYPASIRIDIINAFLTLEEIRQDTTIISNASELQSQIKWKNDSVKIATMNQRIEQENMQWTAGRTNFVLNSFSEKEKLFPGKFNLAGFDYYSSGVFQPSFRRVLIPSTSQYVSSFDWRSRHGANKVESPYYDGHPRGK